MANPKRKKALEAQLTALQRKAVYMLIENELLPMKDQRDKKDIAEELGVTYKTIWQWANRHEAFIEYKNMIADDYLAAQRNSVYASLMSLIHAPQPSVKAIDLYLRRFALLTDKTLIEQDGEGSRTNEDLERELAELEQELTEADGIVSDKVGE